MFIALIPADPALLAQVERDLAAALPTPVRVLQIDSLALAEARLGGGDVEGVFIDISNPGHATSQADSPAPWGNPLEACKRLISAASNSPLVVLCEAQTQAVAALAMQQGAAAYAVKGRADELKHAIAAMAANRSEPPAAQPDSSRRQRRRVCFLGAKGGVGTTTAALNVAAVASKKKPVFLVEMRSELGSLGSYFAVPEGRNLTDLLNQNPLNASSVRPCLWRCPAAPGLQMLLAPSVHDSRSFTPEAAGAAVSAISEIAEDVFLDLPGHLSATNRSVIERSDLVVIVLERESACLTRAKCMIEGIRSWNTGVQIATLAVNRAQLISAVSIASIEATLDALCLGSLPSAPELCARAQNQRLPAANLDPQSAFAQAVISVAEQVLPERRRTLTGVA